MEELGIGLVELGKGLRINNARRTVLARVSGLVSPKRCSVLYGFTKIVYHSIFFFEKNRKKMD